MPPATFLPSVSRIPGSIGLSLSGGGFRATLFHLGAIRRLNEFGITPRLTTISSVSGGSILNGFLASRLDPPLSSGVADYKTSVSAPMRQFCSLDIRRWLGVDALIPGTHNSTGLAKAYNEHLTMGKKLSEMAAAPHHVFCSTDLVYGVNWMFKRAQCGDYQAGFMPTPGDWLVSTAVAASSCFPPVFRPLQLNLDPAKVPAGHDTSSERERRIREIALSDGGVYDNLGLEPIWKDHDTVLVSDGGALFSIGGDNGFAGDIGRFIAIPENQALAVRKRWLLSNFVSGLMKGTYWGIGATVAEYRIPGGYSEELVKNFIAAIRTDLDSFSEGEACVLENHGYLLADAAIRAWVPRLLPASPPAPVIPHPDWMDEAKVREALKNSGKRSLLGHAAP
ncbi:MAG TPA: patatin-like phospholipase family protein [Candidatus Binatia bacterium]|nr:patatin-like phospholipase family protein [Candidatus Binatia bacterium]